MSSYYLGENYPNIYFTQREAECMHELLQGKTNAEIAAALSLSVRTIDFYLSNMRIKLKCRTRKELINKVLNSDFVFVETTMVY